MLRVVMMSLSAPSSTGGWSVLVSRFPRIVDGKMGWVSYSNVDCSLFMGGVGGAEDMLDTSEE